MTQYKNLCTLSLVPVVPIFITSVFVYKTSGPSPIKKHSLPVNSSVEKIEAVLPRVGGRW